MKRLTPLPFILAALFHASVALAEPSGADEVNLKNGGSVRGTVVSVEPGTSVVIRPMGTDASRTIPWAEVADVQKGKYAKETSSAAPSAEPPSGKGVVKVHIDSKKPVNLFEQVATSAGVVGGYAVAVSHIQVVCTSPCDRVVDGSRGQAFAVGGNGVTAAGPLYFKDHQGPVTLRVEPGSAWARWGGITSITLGATTAIVGAVVLGVFAGGSHDADPANGLPDYHPSLVPGGVTLGVGAAVLAAGIVLVATSGTKVDVLDGHGARDAAGRPKAVAAHWWRGEF
jgi:hypothetical protein